MIELALGVPILLLAPITLLPWFRRRLDSYLDAPEWRAFRETPRLKGMLDSHYRVSRRLLRIAVPLFLFVLGLGLILGGIGDVL